MIRYLIVALSVALLSGCSYLHPYRPNIEQGNIVNANHVNQLRTGMSLTQVQKIMGGKPVLENTFNNSRIVYAYQYIPNHGKQVTKQVALTFRNGRLANIQKLNVD